MRLSSLVASFPARRLAAARLQTQALCSLPFLALASLTASSAASAASVAGAAGAAGALATELSPTQAGLLCFSATAAITGTLLQFEGQRTVPAAAAQPIYASAPLLTAMWSLVVLKEPITPFEALGGLGVFCAATLASSGGGDAATAEDAAPLRPLSTEATTDEKNGA